MTNGLGSRVSCGQRRRARLLEGQLELCRLKACKMWQHHAKALPPMPAVRPSLRVCGNTMPKPCHQCLPSVRPYDRGCGAPRPAARARPLHAHLAPPRVLSVADRWQASAESHATLGGRSPSCRDAAVERETRATAACHPSVPTIVAAVLLDRPCAAAARSPCAATRAECC